MILSSNIVYAPHNLPPGRHNSPRLFLAGSIQEGAAEEWQTTLIKELNPPFSNWVTWLVTNPRRPKWNKECKQSIENPEFKQQVDWELDYLTTANVVAVWFDPNTTSPITLAELGLLGGMKHPHVVVYCPDAFWRKGNVAVMTERFGFTLTVDPKRFYYELERKMSAVTQQFEKGVAS